MKEKIIIFLVGLLLGAIISTGSIYIYTLTNTQTAVPTNSMNSNMNGGGGEMNGGGTPPDMPNNTQNNNNNSGNSTSAQPQSSNLPLQES